MEVGKLIASNDLTNILLETDQLARLIVQSEEAKQFQLTKKNLAQDMEAQKLIKEFIEKKEQYEEVERFGKFHPDYKRIKTEMREAKRRLDLNAQVAQFKKAERELENILNDVSKIIANAVSEQIKVPTGNPFWDTQGCGGKGCGKGGCASGACGI